MTGETIPAWMVVITEPGRRATWHVLRTREERALATANMHRRKGSEVAVYNVTVVVEGEILT